MGAYRTARGVRITLPDHRAQVYPAPLEGERKREAAPKKAAKKATGDK